MLFVLAMVGVWAIGTCSGRRGPESVEQALIIGVLVNVCIAVVQVFTDLTSVRRGRSLGVQPTGSMGQPAHLAALLLGGLWLLARRVDTSRWYTAAAVVLVAASIEMTAERFPLILCLPLVVVVTWRKPIRTKAIVGGLIAVGVVIGVGLTQFTTDRTSATSRLAGDVGNTPRTENYAGGVHALLERPLLGWGPARYVAATAPERTEALERVNPDSIFVDVNDWPLHWAVTTGLIGLAALAAWLALAARRASGALLGFAVGVAAVQLLQPQDVAVTADLGSLGPRCCRGNARGAAGGAARGSCRAPGGV